MFAYLAESLFEATGYVPPPVVETPALGCLHPLAPGRYFASPAEYMRWYDKYGPLRGTGAPVVAVLLYRKHVITEQPYIGQLISQLEAEGLLPLPVFINGVEAHTVVRDLLTSKHEQSLLARGITGGISPTLKRDAVQVDAVVSTIGFPLVGGPAGTMEGGRQAEVAKAILAAKDVPYMVAAPLLIQDMESWSRDGVAGLQSVVLYSLPELDGAIDTVPLGGLVGDNIYLVPERVKKMAGRLMSWVRLRRKAPVERKVAVLLYGFPPGVGATGTAALLNVPKSLEALLSSLRQAGYDLGPDVPQDLTGMGEALVSALKMQEDQRAILKGAAGMSTLGAGPAAAFGVKVGAGEMTPARLKELLTYPPEWGPTEWGPMPYLPDNDVLVTRMERQWGELRTYRGLNTSARGAYQVPGLTLGSVWIGVQPPLGIEGDPMRLLFQRDLTPHPQYAAFYKWIQHEYGADVVLHFGMHGTVEWLPGAPLGNTGLSWSDVLLGELPNVYVYAANNPSESIVAKRRGYGTIVSHNVPPYGRAGLYKQLATLRDQLSEYREAAQQARQQLELKGGGQEGREGRGEEKGEAEGGLGAGRAAEAAALAPVVAAQAGLIFDQLRLTGLEADCPFLDPATGQVLPLPAEVSGLLAPTPSPTPTAGSVLPSSEKEGETGAGVASGSGALEPPRHHPALEPLTFDQYASKLYAYLQLVEGRLFSEGLHVLGSPPGPAQLAQYLEAYFGAGLPKAAVEAVAERGEDGAAAVRSRLERLWEQEAASSPFEPALTPPATSAAAPGAAGSAAAAAAAAAATPRPTQEELVARLEEALEIRSLLLQNTEELAGVLQALGGGYVLPEAGGDLLRDGTGVLPTGRNIHALDPYRMPSPAAMTRGSAVAAAILDQHRASAGGDLPETVAVNLWGLDSIKSKGESVAIVLALVGAVPVREGTGRVARFELVPLEQLGRPRVDVLCNMSGIFRDSFQNVVELMDDLFARAAAADEPDDQNFIAKHSRAMQAQGLSATSARLFSNPAGDYGSMVNERVGAGSWVNGDELGDTWAARNAFSYGRGKERGTARPEVLQALLGTTDRIVQQIDSVEYGLTDIQEYYANTGALKRAAEVARAGKAGKGGGGGRVGCSIVEAFGSGGSGAGGGGGGASSSVPPPRELEEVLRLEYRSKLLNPKWAKSMAAQGSGGAYEISTRMTALLGWGATTDFREGWVWDQAAETYVADAEMAETLRKNNPQAFANVVRRMLEAAGRGMWRPSADQLAQLRALYSELDDQLEGVAK
ncbi:Magnesium chelatase [Pleodorina starrii]|nr:Magnesium chelatase [Pleodorina starrii]